MALKLKGADELIVKLDKIESEISEGLKDAISDAAEINRDAAEGKVVVDSGRLKRSIRKSISKDSKVNYVIRVGTNVFYAHMVEFGSVFKAARPFLRNSFAESKPEMVNKIRASLKKDIGKAL